MNCPRCFEKSPTIFVFEKFLQLSNCYHFCTEEELKDANPEIWINDEEVDVIVPDWIADVILPEPTGFIYKSELKGE